MDKMTPICQKGYSKKRYCQEVLISVIESIEKTNRLKKKGAVLSLDIRKAFDSLSHSYLLSVYKFYNFGPKLIRWITLLSTNRKACIIIDRHITTEIFDLERGNAQGDTISPFLFNLGYQILLFKLELCLQIKGILKDFEELARASLRSLLPQAPSLDEVRSSDPKTFALADDCTLIVELSCENLVSIINILNNFENISGLGCNLEKTSLMTIGEVSNIPKNIKELGLNLCNEITLLGAKIKNSGICYESNHKIVLEKVRNTANFWKKFSLSLPGRINVAKTFLYSQINYLGCFLPFTENLVTDLSSEIGNFVMGNLNIGKGRIFDNVENGGLGLFPVKDFIYAQMCSWIKRAIDLDDLWKLELFKSSYGTIFNIRKEHYDKNLNPILFNIANGYEKFFLNFTSINEN